MKNNIQKSHKKRKLIKSLDSVQKQQFVDRLFQYKISLERTIDHVSAFLPNRMPSTTKKAIIRRNSRLIKSVDIILSDIEKHINEFTI